MKPCSHVKRPAPGPIQAYAVMFVPGFPQQRRRIPSPALCARTELKTRMTLPWPVSDVRAQLVCARQSALADVDYGVDEFLWGLLRHIVTDARQDSV